MRRIAPQLLIASALVLASCSSDSGGTDGSKAGGAATTSTTASVAPAATDGHKCDQGASMDAVETAPVAGVDSDLTMTSFDGTEIRLHWFPVEGASADEPAPTILMGPGWSLAGDTSTGGAALFGALSIGGMWDAGYNVLTWDPRGFGESEGVATVNDPTKEGRDVQAMLDFVAEQPEAKTDGDGDPRVGMVGFSYGGGIQLTTSAIDCRIDAIVPGIAWNSLETSLYKADTVKTGWSRILTSTVDPARLDPHIVSASASGMQDGTLSEEDHQWFIDRGPGDEAVGKIDIPTLFVQGTVDTLFTLDEATTNYEILRENDVPTAMLWFCGGHGTCLTDAGDPKRVADASFDWLHKYLDGTTSSIGADTDRVNLIDQDGVQWTAPDWPIAKGEPVTATGSGTLQLTAEGGSGGSITPPAGDPLGGVVATITPTEADNAVNVAIDPTDEALAVGAPELTFTYSGALTDPPAEPITRVFAQLVDDETGVVIGNQITPIQVTLDGESHEVTTDLEIIAHHLAPGRTVTLQLVATTTAYATPTLGGQITFDEITISLPTAAAKGVTKS